MIEVRERLDAHGNVLESIDLDDLRTRLESLKHSGIESLAICFLHSHVNDVHELAAEQLAAQIGFSNISRSSDVAPLIKLVSRAETTTLDAYLNPVLAGYVSTVWQQFGGADRCRLRLMTSGGNLVGPNAFRGRDSILSGPAGGVVALAQVAMNAGGRNAIGLDMGGTSTDVSRFTGRIGRRYESRVAGVRVMTPMMDIETIAAGGGSICDVNDDGRMIVGPASAGASPGPACYGRGGPLTVTDVNLLLGRIPAHKFPFPLHVGAAQRELERVRRRLPEGVRFDTDEGFAEGFLEIAVTHMAEAVRSVSTAQGNDVREMVMVGFGGAAGQHVCRVAEALAMDRIIDHPDAGLMSALGMGLASVGRVVTRGIYQPLTKRSVETIRSVADELMTKAAKMLDQERDEDQACEFDLQCDLRYEGAESSLPLACDPTESLADRFHQLHHRTFGYNQPLRQLELVAIRCEATLVAKPLTNDRVLPQQLPSNESIRIWNRTQWVDAMCLDRERLVDGTVVPAPAMIVGLYSTLLVEPGWQAKVSKDGIIELVPDSLTRPAFRESGGDASTRHRKDPNLDRSTTKDETTVELTSRPQRPDPNCNVEDPVLLEVIARRLQGIADAMGEVLRRTAISVNVKERRDYSCAVFRRDGVLIANAPHVPVHLGAMGHTVRHLIEAFPKMSPGDCFLSNDPYAGGSHLPDLTVVTPVFCDPEIEPDFFVASRAHHAEIGGRTPGSMPPDATSLGRRRGRY